jgi:hypothetical protein
MVRLSSLEFASLGAFMGATTQPGTSTLTTAANGDSLTIQHMTLATLQGLGSHFTFA